MPAHTIASGDIELDAYVAVPDGAGPWPGIVVVHDILGFRGDVRACADRLARHGYVVAAPRLYSRGSKPACLIATMKAAVSGQGPAYADLDATRAWLAARADGTGRVGILGFSIGGDFAMLCAPRYEFEAASVNYGAVPEDAESDVGRPVS